MPLGAGGFAGRGSARQKVSALRQDLAWYGDGLARAARRAGADVLHCPTFRAPLRGARLPVVATVHDLAVLREPGWFPAWSRTYGRHLMPRAIRLADRVVCVSQATARDVSGLLGVPDGRLRVVPNGIDAVFSEPAGPPPVDGPYILFVGTPEPRKNLERLAAAVSILHGEGRPERLVLAGADGWGGVELPRGDRVVPPGASPTPTLRDLYAHASCVAYPSLWEGFGLVAGEALATGCPVVCSDIPALREVAGGDAEYCDPLSVPSIADALRRALDGPRPAPPRADLGGRRGLARRGLAGARRVSAAPLVLVDADTVGRARTGDEAYTINLLRELPDVAPDLAFAASLRDPAAMPDDVPSSVRRIALPVASPYRRIPFALPRLARREGASLVHVQYFVAPRVAIPAVVTVHDLSFTRRPELFGLRDRMLLGGLVPGSVRRARRVIAVSEFTREDLIDRYRVDPDRVVAIRNGVAARFRPDPTGAADARARHGLERPFVLFVGALQPRKNAPALLEAFARLRGHDDVELVLAGVTEGARGGGRERGPRARRSGPQCASSGTSPRRRSPASTRPPRCSHSRRCTRASACRRSRRWRAARRSARARAAGSARPWARRR